MSQAYASPYIHLVFSTKLRQPWLSPEIRPRLNKYTNGILTHLKCTPIKTNCVDDHIHTLFALARDISISDCARKIKTGSNKWIKDTFPSKTYFAWQTGYGAFSVSHSVLRNVEDYIARQEEHHRTLSFQDEFKLFLERHEIEYSEQYL